jgi:ribosomal protein S18 acetylase RimI-like enzyme
MTSFCKINNKLSREDLHSALKKTVLVDDQVDFLDSQHYEETLAIFADSFQDDPLASWFEGGEHVKVEDTKKREFSKNIFAFTTRPSLVRKKGVVLGVKGSKTAATYDGAMVLKPSQSASSSSCMDTFTTIYSAGVPPMYKKEEKDNFGPMATKRLEKASILVKKQKEIMASISESYIYIQTIGVLTSHHGKGLGGRLLKMIIQVADVLEVPLYLETESEENESLYKYFQFKTEETFDLYVEGDTSADARLRMYSMVRFPGGLER